MLLIILSGQRSQSIHLFDIDHMYLSSSRVEFVIQNPTKTSSPDSHNGKFEFIEFTPNRELCVITVLEEYLKRTIDVRGVNKQLLLTYRKPNNAASRDTIKRWVLNCMSEAGIDTDMFKAHSARGASTSYAKKMNVSISLIMKTAGWRNVNTFNKFYNMSVKENYGNQLLMAYQEC